MCQPHGALAYQIMFINIKKEKTTGCSRENEMAKKLLKEGYKRKRNKEGEKRKVSLGE